MASNITRVPLIRALARRGFAAAANQECSSADITVSFGQAENKVKFAAYDNNSPVVSVAVAVKAGSRYETPDTLGASCVVRSCAGLATQSVSKFAIVRLIEEAGASLTAVNDRDTITYTLECLRPQLSTCLPVLSAVVGEQCFKPWEVSDNVPRLEIELAQVTDQARLLDLLHTAAYRTDLGNSIFVPKFRVPTLNSETLQLFVNSNFGGNLTAVGAVGLSKQEAESFASCITLNSIPGSESKGKYYSGELRKPAAGDIAYVAIATEGAGLNKLKEAAALTVLKYGLGTGPRVPYGSNSGSPLARAIAEVTGGADSAISAFNISHSDSGLFGVNLATEGKIAGKVVDVVVNSLRKLKVTDELVARGKATAKVAIYTAGDKGPLLAEDLSLQALFLGSVTTPAQLVNIVDQLSTSDIASAAQRVSSGKLSLAALGDLSTVPYLADLK